MLRHVSLVTIPEIKLKPRFRNLYSVFRTLNWNWMNEVESFVKPTHQIFRDYLLFVLCKIIFNDQQRNCETNRFLFSPTPEIDALWHQHLVRPMSYMTMCTALMKKWIKMSREFAREVTDDEEEKEEEEEEEEEILFRDEWLIDHSPDSADDPVEWKIERMNMLKAYAEMISPGYVFYSSEIPANSEQFRIFVKDLTGKTLEFIVYKELLVGDVKYLLYERESIPTAQRYQRLIFAGMQLENDKTLAQYKIGPDKTLHIVLRPPGC